MSPNKQINPETELTSRITELEQELSLKNKEIEELKTKLSDKEEDLSSKNKEIEDDDKSSALDKPIQLLDSEFIKNLEKAEEISFGSSGKVFKVAKREFYALKVLKKKLHIKNSSNF